MNEFRNSEEHAGNCSDSTTTDIERKLRAFGNSLRANVSFADSVIDELTPPLCTRTEAKPDRVQNPWFGETRMLKRITVGTVSVLLIVVFGLWLTTATASVSFAQIVEQIAAASDYSADVRTRVVDGDDDEASTSRIYWQAPGSYRFEHKSKSRSLGEQDEIDIYFTDKPGIRIDNVARSFTRTAAVRGRMSPLMSLQKLADYKGQASKSLAEKKISGQACVGYEILASEIDRNAGEGTVVVWVNAASLLPVECTYVMQSAGETIEMRFENFAWNQRPGDDLFRTDGPEGYTDATRPARSVAKQTESIAKALRIYSKLADGGYPQATVIYGDVTRDRMFEHAGFAGDDISQYYGEDQYGLIMEACLGFATMNQIMLHNEDASYHGLTVTPNDKNKTLFRWKLDDGGYQVIYGDLRTARESQ